MTPAPVRKVWIVGGRGQLGTELGGTAPAGVSCVVTDRSTVDIGDRARVLAFAAEARPDLIINAAAYTAVDKAESEPDLAFRINGDGAAHLAQAAVQCGARLIQVSTDYVFDGRQSTPYKPDDAPNPLNVYGESKLAGERAVQEITEGNGLIVRTAWVYSAHGNNFARTMLRLLREREDVRVVCDQVGTPTHAAGLAQALWGFSEHSRLHGIYHWTDAGVASWYDFACAISEMPSPDNDRPRPAVVPVGTSHYQTRAKRPPYSVLDKSSTWAIVGTARHWRLELMMALKTFQVRRTGASQRGADVA